MEVKMDALGYIKIPQEICNELGLGKNSTVEICYDHKNIFIKEHPPVCFLCGQSLDGGTSKLCIKCMQEISTTVNKGKKQGGL